MNRRALVLTVAALLLLGVPLGVLARGSGNAGCRQAGASQPRLGCQGGTQQRLRDGSCGKADCPKQGAGSAQRGGCAEGPCDGTGPKEPRAQDGTGNGAPTGN